MIFSKCKKTLRFIKILLKNPKYCKNDKLQSYCTKTASSPAIFGSSSNDDAEKNSRIQTQKNKNLTDTIDLNDKYFKTSDDIKRKLVINSQQIEASDKNSRYESFNNIDEENVQVLSPKDHEIINTNATSENIMSLNNTNIESYNKNANYGLPSDDLNDEFLHNLMKKKVNPFDTCTENISDFGPGLGPTFNFAAYADKSELIQTYIKLGVKLHLVEKNMKQMHKLLTVDLKNDLPVYIQFFHDCGVPAQSLGDIITKDPYILKTDLDDMKTRIRYLRAHEFTQDSIARIITKNPSWIRWSTKNIDERLGHFQNEFTLSGPQVRFLATKQPDLITYKRMHIHENTFAVREQMGFNASEIRTLILAKPRLWMNNRTKILQSFDYIHNSMNLSHDVIVLNPNILTFRQSRLKNRHEFLVELNKVQYDPKKPGYINPLQVVSGTDVEFCRDVAKVSIYTYNLFLRTR